MVSPDQRVAIYRIQADYRVKLASIQKQLADLRAAELKEIEDVLSASQLRQVKSLRDQATRQREARASSMPDPDAADGKVSETAPPVKS